MSSGSTGRYTRVDLAAAMEEIDLPCESQSRLLVLARCSLESFVRGLPEPAAEVSDPHLLTRRYGTFVSLYKGQELRGCIGTPLPTGSLYRQVIELTSAAASQDGRVEPVRAEEIDEITIEISVLSPLSPVSSAETILPGKHGVQVQRGERRAILLPQVAPRHGWDQETFLAQACLKAALAAEAWRDPGTEIAAFTALVFREAR